MQPTHYAIAAGLIIAIVLIAARTWWLRSVTFGQGYDAGYADAAKGHVHTITDLREHVSALQQDIAGHTRSRRSQAEIHQLALDTVMQDADTRIAIYARRANPFTAEDRITLQATASQLNMAAEIYAGLQADDQHRFALQMKQRVLELAERLHTTLAAASIPDADRDLIEWLDKNAYYCGTEEQGVLRFPVYSNPEGYPHVRNILSAAVAQQIEAAASQEGFGLVQEESAA